MALIYFSAFRLKYPSNLGQIIDLETETVIKTAIDINPSVKPNLFQLALVPKNGEISPITFDMEYKAASSKANLNIVKYNRDFFSFSLF